jgi:very-short-patch-repair endonuclease
MTLQDNPSCPLSRSRERVRVRARELRHASPDAERSIWQRLRARQLGGYKFRRQHPIGGYFADFACIECGLVVELDGGQHFDEAAMSCDSHRTAKMNELSFQVLRFNDREALVETDGVLNHILNWLTAHHPHPSPLPQAGEGVMQLSLPQVGEGVMQPSSAQAGEGANSSSSFRAEEVQTQED